MMERVLRMTTGTPIRLMQFFILPLKNTFKYRSPFHRRAREYSARAERSDFSLGCQEVIKVRLRFWKVTAFAGARHSAFSSSSLLHKISSGRETFSRLARLT